MDKSLELLKEAERMIYSLQDAYISHPEADALRKKIRYHIRSAQQSVERTACTCLRKDEGIHSVDCAEYHPFGTRRR